MFRIFWYYFGLIIRAKRTGSDDALAGWCLLYKPSFRLPSGAERDRFIVLRSWKRVASQLYKPGIDMNSSSPSEAVIFDTARTMKETRVRHVVKSAGEESVDYIPRDSLIGSGELNKAAVLFSMMFLLPFIFCWGVFSRNRANIALLLPESVEGASLLSIVLRRKIRTVHMFSPFEKDANAIYLLLKKYGIQTVNKIPSPNLLATHNTEMLTDELTLTCPYQQDELAHYAGTLRFRKILHWFPERYYDYALHYEVPLTAGTGIVGFYSHASWLRKSKSDADAGLGDIQSEQKLITVLPDCLIANNIKEILVFLHPHEKKHPFAEVEKFYKEAFRGIEIKFADVSLSSAQQFEKADVGIGAISTILFERLFIGYKTIFFPSAMTIFPIDGSPIRQVCPTDKPGLESALRNALKTGTQNYFRTTGLGRYTRGEWLKSA